MFRLSMNETTTMQWSFEDDVANYKAAGYTAMGVWRPKLSDLEDGEGAILLDAAGMHVSNLLWCGGFTGIEGCSFKDSVADGIDAVRQAASIGADCLVVYSGGRGTHTQRHAQRVVRDALREIADVAGDYDVTLAIEPMHPGCAADWTFLTGIESTLRLLDSVDNPRVKLVYDTYHMGFDPNAVSWIRQCIDRIAIVHLGDGMNEPVRDQNRCKLGEGRVPLAKLVAALCDAGYDGYFDVEVFGEELETVPYENRLVDSMRVVEELGIPTAAQRPSR